MTTETITGRVDLSPNGATAVKEWRSASWRVLLVPPSVWPKGWATDKPIRPTTAIMAWLGATPHAARLYYLIYERYTDWDTGVSRVANHTLAEALGVSERQVQRLLQQLENCGLLYRQLEGGRRSAIRLRLVMSPRATSDVTQGDIRRHPGRHQTSPRATSDVTISTLINPLLINPLLSSSKCKPPTTDTPSPLTPSLPTDATTASNSQTPTVSSNHILIADNNHIVLSNHNLLRAGGDGAQGGKGRRRGEPDEWLQAERAAEIWNEVCGAAGLPRVRQLSEHRRRTLRARQREHKELRTEEGWHQFCARIAGSAFLRGETGRYSWRATWEWCLSARNLVKVLDGYYDDEYNIRDDLKQWAEEGDRGGNDERRVG